MANLPKMIGLVEKLLECSATYRESSAFTKSADNKEDRIRCLELGIIEQRKDYDVLDGLYESAKTRNITYIAAGLALLGYLYGGATTSKHPTLSQNYLFLALLTE